MQNKLRGHIPEDIGTVFPHLIVLVMSNNEFKGNIPVNICDIKLLEQLDLSNNHFSGGLGHLARGGCFNLSMLSLSNSMFKGKLPSFYGLSSLEFLDLQGNNLSGSITANKFNLGLEVLVLSSNSLEGPIPKDWCGLYSLYVLDLSHNRLNGTVPMCLNSITDPTSIRYLYLNGNRLNGHILDAFYNTSSLLILDLSNNVLTGQIPTCIGNLNGLQALLLRGNQFHSQIPFQLCNLLHLSMFDLSYNNLSGLIPPCLSKVDDSPVEQRSDTSYVNVEFDMGQFIQGLVGLPIEPGPIYKEDWVDFTTKGMAYSYNGDIRVLMSGIDLSCNKLTGAIPPELGNLSNLHSLNLSHHKLWGAIPTNFSNLKQLESLDLSYNNLNGRIPTQLTELDPLGVFKVAYNNLSGEIPFKGHFATFDASSYQSNPFLCGPPLFKNCTTD